MSKTCDVCGNWGCCRDKLEAKLEALEEAARAVVDNLSMEVDDLDYEKMYVLGWNKNPPALFNGYCALAALIKE